MLEQAVHFCQKGIKSVTGNFSRGVSSEFVTRKGRDIAHGVSRYNSDACGDSLVTTFNKSMRFWAMNMACRCSS